jgi:hypothetical protein
MRPLLLTDDQVHSILKIAFHPKEMSETLSSGFIDENERKLAEEEQDEEGPRTIEAQLTPFRCFLAFCEARRPEQSPARFDFSAVALKSTVEAAPPCADFRRYPLRRLSC